MLDLTTILGLLLGTGIVVGAIWQKGLDLGFYLNLPSLMITLGGATAATIVQFPWKDLMNLPSVITHAFRQQIRSPHRLIRDLVRYAEIARRDGILALESVTEEIQDEFLVTGLQLAVDGTDPELIQQMMSMELEYLSERHQQGKKIFDALTDYLPAFGMLGTLIGLVAMLANLQDPKSIGPNMAVALLTTLYGVFGAYLITKPVSEKLEIRSREEVLIREMIILGVMSIQQGDNPRIVQQKLRIFLPPGIRSQEE